MNDKKLESLILSYKNNNILSNSLKIPIKNNNGLKIGNLKLIDSTLAKNDQIISSITKWRNNSKEWFFTQFKATNRRTRDWLNNVVIPSKDRMLFIVEANNKEIIGNGGLCSIKEGYAELDNFIRGEKSGPPDLMIWMEISLLHWAWENLGARKSGGKMFSHNLIAMLNHRTVGYKVIKKNDLYEERIGDDIFYTTDSKRGDKVDLYQLEIELSKNTYKSIVDNYKNY